MQVDVPTAYKPDRVACPICASTTSYFGLTRGTWRKQEYYFRKCGRCEFIYVDNPSTDFENIYNSEYYAGRGADSLVDYEGELLFADTVREYEWRGILQTVADHTRLNSDTRWLDFGCGAGGLVRFLVERHGIAADGFDQVDLPGVTHDSKLKFFDLEGLKEREGYYDVITAIEVFEHTLEPLEVFAEIRRLLRPGGLLFFTTGNAKYAGKNFMNWGYVRPEIHISYFEPTTIEIALRSIGFETHPLVRKAGMRDIIAFKVLKTLKLRRRTWLTRLIPWRIISPIVDRRYGVSAFPFATKV